MFLNGDLSVLLLKIWNWNLLIREKWIVGIVIDCKQTVVLWYLILVPHCSGFESIVNVILKDFFLYFLFLLGNPSALHNEICEFMVSYFRN